MPTYKRSSDLLRKAHGNSALLLVSLNELGSGARQRSLFYERWSDILFPLNVDYFMITLLASIPELRDHHAPTNKIRTPWPKGLLDDYYKIGMPRNSLALQSTRYNLLFPWHPGESKVILRDPELSLLRAYGIKSGLIIPSVIGHSHCALICVDDKYDDDSILTTLLPHAPFLRTSLTITHANILRNHYEHYTPYTFNLSPTEQQIYRLKRAGLTAGQIGKRLNKSESTIKSHMADVNRRLKSMNKDDKSITKPERILPILINSGLI